jgi:hypothetical protein
MHGPRVRQFLVDGGVLKAASAAVARLADSEGPPLEGSGLVVELLLGGLVNLSPHHPQEILEAGALETGSLAFLSILTHPYYDSMGVIADF